MKKNTGKLGIALGVSVLLILFADAAGDGIRDAVALCLQTVIPSLFPFMLAASYIGGLGIVPKKNGIAERLVRGLFGVTGAGAVTILMSYIGGYPVGLRLCADQFAAGRLKERDKNIMAAFCFNSGPAFIITAAGRNMFGSTRLGLLLFAAVTLASMITGILASLPRKQTKEPTNIVAKTDAADLPTAVNSAAKAMGGICLWIVVFGILQGVAQAVAGSTPQLLLYLSEVTAGCMRCAENSDLPMAAAICAFGGFCVHLQVLSDLKKIQVQYYKFLLCRLLHAGLSYGICKLLCGMLRVPVAAAAMTPVPLTKNTALTSAVGAALLAVLCVLLVLDSAPARNPT